MRYALIILFMVSMLFGQSDGLRTTYATATDRPLGVYNVNDNLTIVGLDEDLAYEKIRDILTEISVNHQDKVKQSWKYVVINNAEIKDQILSIFLKEMKNHYKLKKVSHNKIRQYWAHIFAAPIHILVFTDGDSVDEEAQDRGARAEAFSCSSVCRDIALTAMDLDQGFLWMGTMSLIEDEIKSLLRLSEDDQLIATVFLGDIDLKALARAQ